MANQWISYLRLSAFICGCIVFFSLASAAEEEGFKIEVSGWSYSRERKTITSSNRVTVNFSLKNVSKTVLNDVAATITFTTGTGEKAATPLTKNIGSLKPGETQKAAATGDFVPAFSAYGLVVQYGSGAKEEWFGSSDTAQPQPKSKSPLEGTASVVLLGREVTPDRSGRFSGTAHVKNEGAAEGKNMKITVQFLDTKQKKIYEWSGKLGSGTLAGGAEANIPFVVPGAPRNYGGYEIKVGCDDLPPEQALSGGDFTNSEDVEVAKFVFKREGAKNQDLKVSAQARNGLKSAAGEIKLTLTFYGPKKKELKKHVYEFAGELQPREIKPLEFTISGVPLYEAYEPAVSYKTLTGDAKPAAQGKIEAAKFKNLDEVEVLFTDALANDDKSVSLAGALRNGKSTPVKDVVLTIEFTKAGGDALTTVEKTITDVVQPGEERNFVVKAPGAAGFANYTFKFKYSEVKK
ncbi:MAG: hypothetical protein ABSE73_02300 [Planctomycetota bacterium]